MRYQVLYCKKYPDGYKKISAIKDVSFNGWGERELNKDIFGILSIDMSQEKINDWQKYNKYCVSQDGQEIIETPVEYLYSGDLVDYNPIEIPIIKEIPL